MYFLKQLAAIRKQQGLTQQEMAGKFNIHVSHCKRDETGTSQLTLEVFRKIVLALNTSADGLLFDGILFKDDVKRLMQAR